MACAWVQLVAQNITPPTCPESSCISDICLIDLPQAEWLLIYGANGYQACACPTPPSPATGSTVDRIRARRTLYLNNWRQFVQNNMTVAPIGDCSNSYRALVNWDGEVNVLTGLCDVDRRLLIMFDSIQRWDLGPQFQLAIQESACGMHFPRFVPQDSALGEVSPDRLRLTFPRRFLDDVNTRDELLLFMLLHEIGHGVRATDNSLLADDWAARVGLAMYHQSYWTPEFASAYLDRVIAQLTSYMRSQESGDAFGRASPQNINGEEYPQLSCRTHAIRGGYLAPMDASCNTYPAACFDNRLQANEDSLVRTTYQARPCEQERRPPLGEEIVKPEWLLDLNEMCERHPWICDRRKSPGIEPERVRRAIRVNTRRLQQAFEREKRPSGVPGNKRP